MALNHPLHHEIGHWRRHEAVDRHHDHRADQSEHQHQDQPPAEEAPDEAAAFTAWLQEIAQKAAEAGKEGGFLGFGGVAVSETEKATLSEISAALRLETASRRTG